MILHMHGVRRCFPWTISCPFPARVCCVPILFPRLCRVWICLILFHARNWFVGVVCICCASHTLRKPRYRWKKFLHMLRWSNGFPSNFALRCHRFPVPVRSLLLAAGLGMGCHSDWSSEGCEGLQRALFGGADYAPLRIRALSEATCDGLQVMLLSRRSTSLISIFEVIWKPTHSLSGSCIEAMQEDLDLSMTKCPLEFQICIYSYMFYNIHLISRCFFSCRHYSFSQCAARQFEYVLTRQGIQEFTALLWLIGSDVCLNQLNPR